MAHIIIKNLFKSYDDPANARGARLEVLRDINLDVEKGEFITFFGPNGCGKTTLLYIIAGLIPFDKGEVKIDGKPPDKTRKGFIFQNYSDSLFPWRRNIDNICFPLEIKGISKKERYRIAKEFIDMLGLKLPLMSFPYQLSGGQQQLLALVRALIYDPEVLLMDEPFASLDYQTRLSMQMVLLDLWKKTQKTILFVSHEIDEAVFLADRLILFSDKPTTILEILKIDLPRPRTHEVIESAEFFALKTKALKIFKEAIGK
jgi:NitT/TauT family transport system ATP-binding protein